MTNEELWSKINKEFSILCVMLMVIFLSLTCSVKQVKADTLSVQYWEMPQLRYERQGYFVEVGGDSDQEIYSLGKIWTWRYCYAEIGAGWHEYDWGHDADDDLFVMAGVGVEHTWKRLKFAAGYRYTNVNSDADATGQSVDLNGPVFRVGVNW